MRNLWKCILILIVLPSCNDCKYGEGNCLNSENVKEQKWIKATFPEYFPSSNNIDSSVISIRVSQKQVMKGFIDPGNKTPAAFSKLLNVFSGFKNPHNPFGRAEYYYFNGDSSGRISKKTNSTELFSLEHYTSKTNNLHFQFVNIANEVKSNKNKNRYYVIFSDGETSIRSQKNLNKDEFSVIKESTKEILQQNPNMVVGILSLLADFNGEYVYDIKASKHIACKRYLYAICFFDKRFLQEFDRFSELNRLQGGNSFLLNPQFNFSNYQTKYLTEAIDGQPNQASENYYAAIPIDLANNQSIDFSFKNNLRLANVNYPQRFKRETYLYEQVDTLIFGNPKLLSEENISFNAEQKIKVSSLNKSSLIKVDFKIDFNQAIEAFVTSDLLSQDADDNTIDDVNKIGRTDTLKTEGLKEALLMILQALQETKQVPMLSNFVQLGKFE